MSRSYVGTSILLVCTMAATLNGQTVRGRVVGDAPTQPITGARLVLLNTLGDSVAAVVSDSAGRFEFAVNPGVYTFHVFRIGFAPTVTPAFVVTPESRLMNLTIAVPAGLARHPYVLAALVIEGKAIAPHLASFYRHQAVGLGDFVTREQFLRWNPQEVTDIVRRMPSFVVRGNPTYGHYRRDGTLDTRRYRVEVATRSRRRNVECPVLLFLDGVAFGTTQTVDIEVLPVEALEAVETYSRPAQVPPEYNRAGADCGVIAFWTRRPGAGDRGLAFELGLRYGGSIVNGGFGRGRLGAHLATWLAGPLEFYTAFHLAVNIPAADSTSRTSGWFAQVAVRFWPAGEDSPLFLGTGVVASKRTTVLNSIPSDLPDIDTAHTVFAGLRLKRGPVSPFVEAHVLDPLRVASIEVQLFGGVAVRF